mmetsp:Transcript_5328/g.14545  ORF Transcript_5328/g.14545 Transcript_5328/m.14545 type:complete len:207 (+) Transcript_5328:1-621(+)
MALTGGGPGLDHLDASEARGPRVDTGSRATAASAACSAAGSDLLSKAQGIHYADPVLHEHLDEPLRLAADYARSLMAAAGAFGPGGAYFPHGVHSSDSALAAAPEVAAFVADTARVDAALTTGEAAAHQCVAAHVRLTSVTNAAVVGALSAIVVLLLVVVVRPTWRDLERSSRRAEHMLLLIPPAIARRSGILNFYDAADSRPTWR